MSNKKNIDRLKFLEYTGITDKDEQWKILTELFPIQKMKIKRKIITPTKYGDYISYYVRLEINGVGYKTIFNDSIWNYENGTRSADVDILACIFMDKKLADRAEDLQEFCRVIGYNIEDLRLAQRAYRECKRAQRYFKKVLTDYDLEKLSELFYEWGY